MPGYNFTDDVRRGLQAAREEAFRLRHDAVQPVHITLGVLRAPGKTFTAALRKVGAEPKQLSQIIGPAIPPPLPDPVGGPDLPYTAAAKSVLELSMQEAQHLGHTYVAPEHLLLGVLRQGGNLGKLLGEAGVTADGLRVALQELGPSEPSTSFQHGNYRYSLVGTPRAMRLMSFFFVTAGPAAWLALLIAVIALVVALR
jgi:ATP-dependent Clp protease ATP-binding subunit ClpC